MRLKLVCALALLGFAVPLWAETEWKMVDGILWNYVVSCEFASIENGHDFYYDDGYSGYTDYEPAIDTFTTGAITVPSTLGDCPVTSIGERAFYNCSRLTSVTIPDGVTSIGSEAFSGCSGLMSMTIPASVTSIGSDAFSGCSGLTSFAVDADNPNYCSVNGLLLTKDRKSLIAGFNGNVTIPDSVTSIDRSAFYGYSGLTSVTIPASVTSIGYQAFSGCSGLTSVTIPASVTSIGNYAFSGCSSLMSVTIPGGITSIGYQAFSGCSGLTSVTIPGSVKSIGDYAFSGCSGLTSATIPGSVTSIGYRAFYGCSGLTSVTIPDSVTSIGVKAFFGCSGLTSVTIGYRVTSIGQEAFSACSGLTSFAVDADNPKYCSVNGLLLTKVQRSLIAGLNGNVTIPDSVTSIGERAFYGYGGLTSVTIPASVTSIASEAFYGCSGLKSVTIPASVTSIEYQAFYGCSALTSVTIPDSVTRIGVKAFYYCSGLTSVTIGDSVTSIGDCAFEGCSGLTSVAIPASVTSIGVRVFYGCRHLTNIHFQGNAPSSVGGNSFYQVAANCVGYVPRGSTGWGGSIPRTWNGLRIEYEPCLHDGGTRIVNVLESTCTAAGYTGDTACDICDEILASGESIPALGHVEVETKTAKAATCTEAGWTHELRCSRCNEVLEASSAIHALGHDVVESKAAKAATCTEAGWTHELRCSRCNEVLEASSAIPALGHDGVQTKAAKTATCTEAGWTHEVRCSRCNEVLEASSAIPALGHQIGEGVITQAPTLAEDGIITYYCTNCGTVLKTESVSSWHIDENGVLTSVDMGGATEIEIPQSVTAIGNFAFYDCTDLTSVTIPDSVTSIGNSAFEGCSGLTSVTIPDSVTSIGYEAFESCSELTSVTIGNGVTSIGWGAFADCRKLTSVTMGSGVTSIGDYAFSDCSGLTSVTIPDSVTSIGEYVFAGCSSLTSVTIPDSVTSIGEYAFSDCSGLTSVTIPDSVTSIGNGAFEGCSALTSVTISDSVTSIGGNAFSFCEGLTSFVVSEMNPSYCSKNGLLLSKDEKTLVHGVNGDVTIPDSVTSIGGNAFKGCSGLTSVTMPDSVTSIGDSAFYNCSGLTSATIPDSVTSIGASAFKYCPLETAYISTNYNGNLDMFPSATDIVRYNPHQTVTFDAAGGTVTPTEKTVDFGGEYGELPTPVRTGFTFACWKLGDDVIDAGTTVTALDNHTMTAQWMPNKYTVTFNANGGDGGTSGKQDYGTAIVAPTVTRTGYTFVGWSPEVAANVPASNVTYTAQWTANQYTVTFDANGGEVGTATKTVMFDNAFGELPEPTRMHYEFAGWFTAKEDGESVDAGTIFNTDGDVTLYARWRCIWLYGVNDEEVEITGTIYGAEYSGEPSIPSMIEGMPVTVIADGAFRGCTELSRIEIPESVEHIGGGVVCEIRGEWAKAESGQQVGGSVYRSAEIGRNGEASMSMEVYVGEATDWSFDWWVSSESGYDFLSWRLDGVEKSQISGDAAGTVELSIPAGRHTIEWSYAKDASGDIGDDCGWVRIGRVSGSSGVFAGCGALEEIVFNGDCPTVGEGAFDGIGANCRAVVPNDCASWDEYIPGTWHGISIDYVVPVVKFDANGGDADVAIYQTSDGVVGADLPVAERVGYLFCGWWTDANGGEKVEEGAILSGSIVAYAHWDANTYTVTFNANGGEVGETERSVEYGSAIGELPVPTIADGEFIGWFTEQEGGEKVCAQTTFADADNRTIYAHWRMGTTPMVSNVSAKQRFSENGKVDISFDVAGEFDVPVELYITANDAVTGEAWTAFEIGELSGDTNSLAGTHSVVWDMGENGSKRLSPDTVFTVSYTKMPAPYIAIDLSGGTLAVSYAVTELYDSDIPKEGWTDTYKTDKLIMRRIREVTSGGVLLKNAYYIGVFEVTQRQWELVVGSNPSFHTNISKSAIYPVERVSYNMIRGVPDRGKQYDWPITTNEVDEASFMGILRAKTDIDEFDLPTEAQWEYACRAGTTTEYYTGNGTIALDKAGWYQDNTGSTQPVGTKDPNTWGLYDMHGNVWEWCLDRYDDSKAQRVMRGGGWQSPYDRCYSYYRGLDQTKNDTNRNGFRLARTMSYVAPIALASASAAIDRSMYDWALQYPKFAETFLNNGENILSVFSKPTGKRDGAGKPMSVWHDFVVGTDPTKEEDVFKVDIDFDEDGNPIISWTPELTEEEAAKRVYKKLGKMRLDDPKWSEIEDNEADYNFFKVEVEMR